MKELLILKETENTINHPKDIRFDVDKMERILTVYNKKTGKIINEIPFEFADKKLLKKLGVKE